MRMRVDHAAALGTLLALAGCYASHDRARDSGPHDVGSIDPRVPDAARVDASRPVDARVPAPMCEPGTEPCGVSCCDAGAVCIVRVSICCPPPYWRPTPDDRCVWSCSEGTTPDPRSRECVCQPGLRETGTDSFGRRVCT
ncbi:MAG: hypothetical protein J0L92_26870 [Deltaproteobacteria bacterium]|nr:hypothetical protein [Deltaproteobacteria bacterium]